MASRDAVIDAIDGLYSAAMGETSWESALDRLTTVLNFSASALTIFEGDQKPLKQLWRNIDEQIRIDYMDHYRHIDPCLMFKHPNERLLYDYRFISESGINRSEYYGWKQKAHGMCYHVGARTGSDTPFLGALTLHRARSQGHADEGEIALFGRVFAHLEQALTVEYRLGLSAAQSGLAVEVLESNRTGIVMLNRAGRVVFVNQAARTMAQLGDGFTLGAEGLTPLRSREDSILKGLIASAHRDPDGPERRGGAMRLPRRSERRDYAAIVSPLSVTTPLFAGLLPTVAVLLTDPDMATAITPAILEDLYGLTPAEIRVAERLATGETPKQTAEALGVNITTVREHLASLFRKTGTARQSDLIRLLLALPM